jgi:putative phosphoribosyl transferase
MPNALESDFFLDREDAVKKMLDSIDIERFKSLEPVVIGVSEGGVYFANALARELDTMMDILLTEPINAPNNDEVKIAMISETQEVVMNRALIDSFDISEDFVYAKAQDMYEDRVISYVYRYRKGQKLVDLDGRDVILVDECVESGLTMMVALKSVISRGAKNVYIVTPILDKSVYHNLLTVCDGVFCSYPIEHYISVEYYFKDFKPIEFKEIVDMMEFYANKRYNEITE